MMDTPWAEPSLCDFESAPLAQQDVTRGDGNVVEQHLHVPVRRVVVTEDRQRTLDLDAGRIGRNHDHRLLFVPLPARVGLAHHDVDLAAGITRPARPPFAAVDYKSVAAPLDARLNVCRV